MQCIHSRQSSAKQAYVIKSRNVQSSILKILLVYTIDNWFCKSLRQIFGQNIANSTIIPAHEFG